MEEKIIRVLNIVPNMRAAGIETFIMNVYRNIDRSKIQFDFIVHNKKRMFFDDEIEKLGGKIYRFSFKDDKNIFKYIYDLNKFFKEHKEYNILHGHMQSMMPLYLFIAKLNNVKTRIAHSHNGDYEKTLKGRVLHYFSRFSKLFSTENWACSKVAGDYLFGKKKFEIIYNGIETEKFKYKDYIRKEIRKELKLEKKFVIGHIGRFELQKDHDFIIDLFKEINKVKKNSILLLFGEGKLKSNIEFKVKKLGLEEKVYFMGVKDDIYKYYNAMDIFILPSIYEGLPVVGIEAQINGVKCIFSNNITPELNISSESLFLKKDILLWKDEISKIEKLSHTNNEINFGKFDIKLISKKIKEKYIMYEKK